jgi:DNA-binding NarL/FixJ family response regulator
LGTNIIRLLLVDDHAVVRNGIRLMLSTSEGMCVTGEAESAEGTLDLVKRQPFDVALVDIGLPDRSGIDLIRLLREQQPKLAVLMLSIYLEEIYVVRAFKQGAAGYLNKTSNTATLVAAIRKVAAGGKYVSPHMMEKLAGMLGGDKMATHEALSDRELDVLKRLAAGNNLVKIGESLHLSPNTVSTYRTRILEKLQMTSNAELIRYAIENGLVN